MLEPLNKYSDDLVQHLELENARLKEQVMELQHVRARLEMANYRLEQELSLAAMPGQQAA